MLLTEIVTRMKEMEGGEAWLRQAGQLALTRPEFRELFLSEWRQVPWNTNTRLWADSYWPGGFEAYRKARWSTSNPAPHDGTHFTVPLGLVYMGCPEYLARARTMSSWSYAKGYASRTDALQRKLGPFYAQLRGETIPEKPVPPTPPVPQPAEPTPPPVPSPIEVARAEGYERGYQAGRKVGESSGRADVLDALADFLEDRYA